MEKKKPPIEKKMDVLTDINRQIDIDITRD